MTMIAARNRLLALAAASALAIATVQAVAQSLPNPAFYYGFEPTPGQWNRYFSQKADYPGVFTYPTTWTAPFTISPQMIVNGSVGLTGNIQVSGTLTSAAVVPLLPINQFLIGNVFGVAVNTTLVGDCTYPGSINCLNNNGAPFVAIATIPSASNLTSGTLGCAFMSAFSGDVNSGPANCATTIQPGVVTGAKIANTTIAAGNFVNNTLSFAKLTQPPGNTIWCNNGTATANLQFCATAPSAAIPAINLVAGNVNGGVVGNLPVANLSSGVNAGSTTWWRGDNTWATPPGSHILLNTVTAGSGALVSDTTSFTSGSNALYASFEIIFNGCFPATNSATPQLLIHTAGTGFPITNYFGAFYRADNAGSSVGGITTGIQLNLSQTSTQTNNPGMAGRIIVSNPSNTTSFKTFYGISGELNTSPIIEVAQFMGYWQGGTAAVDGFAFNYNIGNVATCSFKVYGIP